VADADEIVEMDVDDVACGVVNMFDCVEDNVVDVCVVRRNAEVDDPDVVVISEKKKLTCNCKNANIYTLIHP